MSCLLLACLTLFCVFCWGMAATAATRVIQSICVGSIGSKGAPSTMGKKPTATVIITASPIVRRQHEGEGLYQVVVDPAPLLDGRRVRGEVVVGEHDVRRLLGDVRARDTHGYPDVGLLEGRGVVCPVAGHSHDLVLRLQAPDQPELVLGGDPREDARARGFLPQLLIGEDCDAGTGQGRATLG